MKFRTHFFIPISVVVALAACVPPATQEPEPEAPSTEADVEAINSVVGDYERGLNTADLESIMALYADGAVAMRAGVPADTGKEAIEAWYQVLLEETALDLTFSRDESVRFDGWAFVRTTNTGTTSPRAGGEPGQLNSKSIFILQRQDDGSWKIARYIFNSDNPPPGS